MSETISLAQAMPANAITPLSDAKVQPTPLVDHHTYYRSKLYSAHCALNPLVAACAPLLSLIDTLKNLTPGVDGQHLSQELTHEIKAFESKAQIRETPSSAIMAARYVLCHCLDHAIAQSPWDQQQQRWQHHRLCVQFYRQPASLTQLTAIIERTLASDEKPIDLMELFYLLLQSTYPHSEDHADEEDIHSMCVDLYQAIELNRHAGVLQLTNTQLKLLPHTSAPIPNKINKPKQKLAFIVTVTLLILAGIYIGFSLQLRHAVQSGNQILSELNQPTPLQSLKAPTAMRAKTS